MRKLLLLCLAILFSTLSFSQYTLTANNGDTIYTTSGNLYLGSYTPIEIYTVTICSDDVDCSHVNLTFDAWSVGSGTICVYDGASNTSPLIGCNAWGTTQTVSASVSNPSGCITIEFTSPVTGSTIGGNIGCNFNCQSIFSEIINSNPVIENIDGYESINVCAGQEFTLQGNGIYLNETYFQSNSNSSFTFDFGDGNFGYDSLVTHSYNEGGIYQITLSIEDVHNCLSSNYLMVVARVSERPEITGSISSDSVCQGEHVDLNASFDFESYLMEYECNLVNPDTTFIPDGSGTPLETVINVDCFMPGQTLDNIEDLLGICAIMEHSFLGDLIFSITCPYNTLSGDATTVILENQEDNTGTHLGEPIDDGGLDPGVGWEYCWTIHAYADYLQTMGQYGGSVGTLTSGSYITYESLDLLVGCELNGEWTLSVSDNWAIDNGYVFAWWLNFDPSIMPSDITLNNSLVDAEWSANETNGGEIVWQDYMGYGIGEYYTGVDTNSTQYFMLSVTDDFGCTYDTTFYVTVYSTDSIFCCITPEVNVLASDGVVYGLSVGLERDMLDFTSNWGEWTGYPLSSGVVSFSPDDISENVTATVTEFGYYIFKFTEHYSNCDSCYYADSVQVLFLDSTVNINELEPEFLVYPNPFKTELIINNIQVDRVYLKDALGRLIHMDMHMEENRIRLIPRTDIDTGIYFLVIEANESSRVIKVIKE